MGRELVGLGCGSAISCEGCSRMVAAAVDALVVEFGGMYSLSPCATSACAD